MRRKSKSSRFWVRIFALCVVAVVVCTAVFVLAVELTPFDASKLDTKSLPTTVYANDGSVYMTVAGPGATDLGYNQIPANLRNALVATEDHTFWNSGSVNVRGLFRAAFVDLWSGSYAQGGSTIQEQLAKIVYLNSKKTLSRKFSQIVLGVQIDRYFTKQEILAMYLNKVYLGESSVGVEQAAERYFGIDLRQNPSALTLDQAALLAGLPQAPSAYDPIAHPTAALARRNEVLDNMAKYGYISAAVAAKAKAQPIQVSMHDIPGDAWGEHPLFTNFLFDYASRQGIKPEELLQGGLKIYTTLNPKVQQAIDDVFWNQRYESDFPGPKSGTVVEGAALFVDPTTGGILGGAGSRRQDFVPGGLDRIYSESSPGSSIKPIMDYAPAIESGKFGPSSILNNTPHDFGGGYIPQNYDRGSAPASVTLQYALQTSQNVASVWLLQQIGIDTGTNFAANDGIPLTASNRQQLGVAIGGDLNVSPYIMAQAYEAFANQGVQMQEHLITKIVNPAGDTLFTYQSAAKRIMSAQTAAIMTNLLENVVQRGTGTSAQVQGWDVAGKTGTVQYSSSGADQHSNWLSRVWFDGYTANLVGSIYLGYDQTNAVYHLTDFPDPVANAAKLWSDITTNAEAGITPIPLNSTVTAPAQSSLTTPGTTSAISNLTATFNPSGPLVTLTWTADQAQNVTFVIDRQSTADPTTGAGPGMILLGQTTASQYDDPTVDPNVTYTYIVQPTDPSTGQPVGQAASVTVTIPSSTGGPTPPPGGSPPNNQTSSNGAGPGTGNTVGGLPSSPPGPPAQGGNVTGNTATKTGSPTSTQNTTSSGSGNFN